jgi:DNA-binding winged helix-turn-helix (wHTH) protein
MASAAPVPSRIRFADYELDLRTAELRKHGRKIRLAGRPFQILAMLLEQPGEMITREEIRKRLWDADTFVDFDHGMNSAIRKLRDALGETAAKPRFIETFARRGYRFIGVVEGLESSKPRPQPTAAEPAAEPRPDWVGRVATVVGEESSNYVLLPADEQVMAEKETCEAAKDDLGISLLVAAQKLLMVARGTQVKILEASHADFGCRVRILQGQFIGELAFAPRRYLTGLS